MQRKYSQFQPNRSPILRRMDMSLLKLALIAPGHSTESFFTLKHKIQDLIEAGEITFAEQPKIKTNALPNQKGNMVSEEAPYDPKCGLPGRIQKDLCMKSSSVNVVLPKKNIWFGTSTSQTESPVYYQPSSSHDQGRGGVCAAWNTSHPFHRC